MISWKGLPVPMDGFSDRSGWIQTMKIPFISWEYQWQNQPMAVKHFKVMRAEDKKSDHTHGDHHALWIDPADSKYMINGNDGGVVVTYNGGKRWYNFFRKIPTTQFYNVTYDMTTPYNVFGSVQDEGSFMGSIKNTYGKKDNSIKQWNDAPGGEGTIIAVDPQKPDLVYASSFYGRLMRSDLRNPTISIKKYFS